MRELLEERRWRLMNSYGGSAWHDGRVDKEIAKIDAQLAALK